MNPVLSAFLLVALAQSPSWPLADARLSLTGLGPVRIGMNEAMVRQAAQTELMKAPSGSEGCVQLHVRRDPGIVLMFEKGVLTRIDFDDAHHATLRGLRIGDSERRARELYSGEYQENPHKYVADGHYLTIRSSDKRYALVVETDGRYVSHLRAGVVPSAEYVEGCS
jgi:hypothetical protein